MSAIQDEDGKGKLDELGRRPEKKKKKKKREGSGPSTFLLAALPILISVLSSYYAYSQVQVGKALETGGDYASALALYNAVAPNPQDPDAFANAKRNAALLWYQLAENPGLSAAARNADEASARSNMVGAADAYAESEYVDLNDEVESIALTYFDDAAYQSMINCATARGDLRAADSSLGRATVMAKNAQIKDATGIANAQLDARCAG